MDIVSRIASYAKAVPAGLKAAGQELARTAGAVTGADVSAPAAVRPKRKTKSARRGTTGRRVTPPKATPVTAKQPKAKRSAPKQKRRKSRR
jgi:hypothetical protein